jgi:hypothetical protein
MNTSVFISVGGIRQDMVIWEIYRVAWPRRRGQRVLVYVTPITIHLQRLLRVRRRDLLGGLIHEYQLAA